jgi:hypothetical protein
MDKSASARKTAERENSGKVMQKLAREILPKNFIPIPVKCSVRSLTERRQTR